MSHKIIEEILFGIDKEETEDARGWWETSAGAEFGAKKLKELRALLDKPARPVPECVGDLERFEADDGVFVRLGDVIDMLGNEKAAQQQGEPVAFVDERAAYEEWQWRQDWPIEKLAGSRRAEYFKRKFLDPERYETDRFNIGFAVWLACAIDPDRPEGDSYGSAHHRG